MRIRLLSTLLLFPAASIFCQVLTPEDFILLAGLPEKKVNNYLTKSGFKLSGQQQLVDTMQHNYCLTEKKTLQVNDSAIRSIQSLFFENKTAFNYSTSSFAECKSIIRALKEKGFYCENENHQSPFLYQRNDVSVKLTSKQEDTVMCYNFLVRKDILPTPRQIHYAEDFLAFHSHENLAYVFGKSNVQKDIYYFSDSDMVRCSVLFPNTNRQVIFIWKDELDRTSISHVLIGNSLRGHKSQDDKPVAENVWTMKNGLHPNMSLSELVHINASDISFYGGNSQYPGIVVPGMNGNIDFKNTGVILSCLNCNGSDFLNREMISANEAIENSKRLFVLAVILVPHKDGSSAAMR